MKRFPLVVCAIYVLSACSGGGSDAATTSTTGAASTTSASPAMPTTTTATTTPTSTSTSTSSAPTTTIATPATSSTVAASSTTTEVTVPVRTELPTIAPVAQADIGAIGPGLVVGAGLTGVNAVIAGGHQNMVDVLGATVVEWSTRYDDQRDADGTTHRAVEKLIYQAESALPPIDILGSLRSAIESTQGAGVFEVEQASGASGTTSQESLSARAAAGTDAPSWEVRVISDSAYPSIVQVEVESMLDEIPGPSPLFGEDSVIQAFGGLDAARVTVEMLGWMIDGWQWHHGVNQTDGAEAIDGQLHFTASGSELEDVAVQGSLLKPLIGTATYEDIKPERQFYIVPNGNWTLVFDEVEGVVSGTFAAG